MIMKSSIIIIFKITITITTTMMIILTKERVTKKASREEAVALWILFPTNKHCSQYQVLSSA